jgi:hypothetical protein
MCKSRRKKSQKLALTPRNEENSQVAQLAQFPLFFSPHHFAAIQQHTAERLSAGAQMYSWHACSIIKPIIFSLICFVQLVRRGGGAGQGKARRNIHADAEDDTAASTMRENEEINSVKSI